MSQPRGRPAASACPDLSPAAYLSCHARPALRYIPQAAAWKSRGRPRAQSRPLLLCWLWTRRAKEHAHLSRWVSPASDSGQEGHGKTERKNETQERGPDSTAARVFIQPATAGTHGAGQVAQGGPGGRAPHAPASGKAPYHERQGAARLRGVRELSLCSKY